ncbi:MAG: hypothetical protein JJE51_08505 [Thermoanaerobaculia bacterium]|nr:hypothetical protein [Thermoanaerobaculia bacterium]
MIIAVSMLSAAAGEVRADAQVEEKTEFKMTGVVGAMVNVFGGKAAREGVTNETTVKGNRRNRVTANSGELVDLNEEKIYRIDYARKTYTVQTFDEVRKQFEEGMKRSKERPSEDSPKDKKEGPEYEVDFDVKETSEKQVINGWNTKRMIMTVTVREKGKKLADSGGAVITSDMWMGPQLVSYKEIADFDRRYYAKLYGGLLSTGDMQQTVALMAATPAFAKGMKAFNEKKVTLTGTPIRTEVTFETVTGKNQPRKSEEEQASEDEQTAASRMIGGLMGKMRKRQSSEEKSDDGAAQKKSSDPNRSVLFSSKSEVLKADGNASADDVAIPAGFKKK